MGVETGGSNSGNGVNKWLNERVVALDERMQGLEARRVGINRAWRDGDLTNVQSFTLRTGMATEETVIDITRGFASLAAALTGGAVPEKRGKGRI